MTLAEAGALCAGLTHQEHDPQKDLQGLARLARWMIRFTPVVAVEPPDALFLDLTGSERLFHGLDKLAKLIADGLRKLGLSFQMAMAPTPGAAWALTEGKDERPTSNVQRSTSKELQNASSPQLESWALNVGRWTFAPACSTSSVQHPTPKELQDAPPPPLESWALNVERWTFALFHLPIESLRLPPDLIHSFHHLGIDTIAQLMQLPRDTIPARFGQIVLHRLDQALGTVPEPLNPIPHARPIRASIEFESGVESLTDLWQACKLLLEQIVTELRQRSCGARQLLAEFFLPGEEPIVKKISLSRPTANLATLWNLLRCSTETIQCGQDGFNGLKLSVPLFSRLSPEQLHLLDQESQAAAGELDHLIERLQVRLGDGSVLFPRAVESHLPEKATCYEAGERTASTEGKRSTFNAQLSTFKEGKDERPTSNVQRPTSKALQDASPLSLQSWTLNVGRWTFAPSPEEPIPKQRPLHLFPLPIPIQCSSLAGDVDQRVPISFTVAGEVHPLVFCNGPERITGPWWEGRNKTRDYFDAEDRDGQRFWIFRVEETREWYLHGV